MTKESPASAPARGQSCRTCRAGLRDILCPPLQKTGKNGSPSSREHACTGTDYPSLHPMICYNPPHMDDVQTSKKKCPQKKEWRDFIP